MLKVLPAAIIFLGSYLPLFLILLAQTFPAPEITFPCGFSLRDLPLTKIIFDAPLPLVHLSLSTASFISVCGTYFFLEGQNLNQSIKVTSSKPMATELMNYVLPYVVSFMGIDFYDERKFIGFIIFLGWMFILTYRSGQILMNPVLILFGYRLHEIKYHFIGNPKEIHTTAALHKGKKKFIHGRANARDIENILIVKERDQ
ncbi:hypothetical protein [Antarcticimicrobium sediminis]|uniref:Uncharacterized protein n=1 Tax=Antarcticimicrobium sediminis TaxID=2546227 RepID=A0A4R5EJQ3_9RHOB|nr:hypothetical protein [Antarcticimicrobium sediminis]TDE34821.1 hypothetical protein E1B25_19005 [Antarcticimicrobium sediminis]